MRLQLFVVAHTVANIVIFSEWFHSLTTSPQSRNLRLLLPAHLSSLLNLHPSHAIYTFIDEY